MSSPSDPGFTIRPMRTDDVPAVERLTDEGFYELMVRTHTPDEPVPVRRSGQAAELWARRIEHILRHDPGGCWVAEGPSGLVGAAAAIKRDLTWILATYVVRPGLHGQGLGRQLLEAALAYGSGCLRGMICSSADPRAARRYRLAGFTLHPTMSLTGVVDRSLLPVVERVREGTTGDIDLMDSVDRQVRDAAHGVDHEVLTQMYRLVVVDRSTGSGYAYVAPGGSPYLLAATNRRTATDLLWEALAGSDPGAPATIGHVTAANEWAVDVGLAARLPLRTSGYLALRGMKPPAPYLPSGHFL
ncbi:MAG TPA: GNAT family N-acetyltransferase [Nocardioidaceae bacterium]|nr:GNAT family N-acetyltransferase [Nocardioidaceae bacterium]